MINYIEYNFEITPLNPGNEIVIALLAEIGFESFVETPDGILAYVQYTLENEEELKQSTIFELPNIDITYEKKELESKNWNEEWEKNFSPINVDNTCIVRAPFHKKQEVDYDILISPKMSFGTGHHETTYMMIKHLLQIDLKNKTVMDMGCGTAILAILAKLKGSAKITGIDIDEWAYENAKENLKLNNLDFPIKLGGSEQLEVNEKYDIFLANINRNILLKEISTYTNHIQKNGLLLLSGFYQKDFNLIVAECSKNNLKLVSELKKNYWLALCFQKQS